MEVLQLRVIGETDPEAALDLGPGEACIVRKGEWHRVLMVSRRNSSTLRLDREGITEHCERCRDPGCAKPVILAAPARCT